MYSEYTENELDKKSAFKQQNQNTGQNVLNISLVTADRRSASAFCMLDELTLSICQALRQSCLTVHVYLLRTLGLH